MSMIDSFSFWLEDNGDCWDNADRVLQTGEDQVITSLCKTITDIW